MMSDKLIKFRESLRYGMIENFKNDGYLVPILFFLEGDVPNIIRIPSLYFGSEEGHLMLADIIKEICTRPNVLAAGIINEASGVMMNDDSELAKLFFNGDITFSEIKDKKDIIVMIFSTPEGDEPIVYTVDIDSKTVLEEITDDNVQNYSGIFSHFFTWTAN